MNTAFIRFEHDIEDGWYRMREPDGTSDTWDRCINAFNFAKERGWQVVWEGDERYKPKNLAFDEL